MYKTIICVCLLGCMSVITQRSWALACFAGSGSSAWNGTNIQVEAITQPILVPKGIIKANTTLWRSQNFKTTFTCFDDWAYGQPENAKLYWDPQNKLKNVDPSIQVGITIDGIDYPLTYGLNRNIGLATQLPISIYNCRSSWNFRGCATSRTISVNYSIFVKSTGISPPSDGRIKNSERYSIFQVDGFASLNSKPNSNFNLYIQGLNNIKFVDCNPQVTIQGTSANTIDFGSITYKSNKVNQILSRASFNVVADLSRSDTGGVCNGNVLMASFSATNTANSYTILPIGRDDLGIQLFQTGNSLPLSLNTPVVLATLNQGTASNTFDAALLQLKSNLMTGRFSAVATVEVTFK